MALTFSRYDALKKGGKAPDFSLPGIDGRNYSLKDFKGAKGLLIVFMCNHCPYVKAKIDFIVELDKKYRGRGLKIVGINSNDAVSYPDDAPERMKEFAIERGMKFPYLFDESQETARKYGAECTPDPFLFDAALGLAYHGRIDDAHGKPHGEAGTNELEQAIAQLLETGKAGVAPLPSAGCSIKWKSQAI